MLKIRHISIVVSFMMMSFNIISAETYLSKPINFVNDYADMLSDSTEQYLNNSIKKYKDKSGMEICVLTVDRIPSEYSSFDFSVYIFKKWGIGEKSSNNGILILISKYDKVYEIRTGYGAESVLTDFDCSRLGRECLVSNFKKGQFEYGIVVLVLSIQNKIGYSSYDIERFKADKLKAEKEASIRFKENTILFFEILTALFLFGLLIWAYIKRYNKLKELKNKITKLVDDIHAVVNNFNTLTKLNYASILALKPKFDSILDNIDLYNYKLTQQIYDAMYTNYNELYSILQDAKKYAKYIDVAHNSDMYVNNIKTKLIDINKLSEQLAFYNINKSNLTIINIDILNFEIKKNIDKLVIIELVDNLLSYDSLTKNEYDRLISKKNDISTIISKLKNYKTFYDTWVDDLKYYELYDSIEMLQSYDAKFVEILKLPENKLFEKYEYFNNIETYVQLSITEEKNNRRRKAEDEEREERKKYSSMYTSGYSTDSNTSYGSDSSYSSDFSFGGGDTGGGGASGSW